MGKLVETDKKQWQEAMDAAAEIRGLWATQTLNFLAIGARADTLKSSKTWTKVCPTWGQFCEENLGKSPTTVRIYSATFKYFVASGYITYDQAAANGPRLLTWSQAKIKKLTDANKEKAKDILIAALKETDKKRSIIELLPPALRDVEVECDKVLDFLDKVFDLASGIDATAFSTEFLEEANNRLDKIAGCLVR